MFENLVDETIVRELDKSGLPQGFKINEGFSAVCVLELRREISSGSCARTRYLYPSYNRRYRAPSDIVSGPL
jgi:hypothetical protein